MVKESGVDRMVAGEVRRLRRLGAPIYAFKVHGGAMQRSGVPDWHLTIGGRSVWVECKRPGGELSRLQRVEIRRLERAGAIVGVVRGLEDFRDFLKSHDFGLTTLYSGD